MITEFDRQAAALAADETPAFLEKCNQELSDMAEEATNEVLDKVLKAASNCMKNGFGRSDA